MGVGRAGVLFKVRRRMASLSFSHWVKVRWVTNGGILMLTVSAETGRKMRFFLALRLSWI
ncbi:Uncharacterised protein [Mycobacteroides abscessus subsp. massiliense]|nr:Uncharacterised protein [Mycobacteroides abscessus subsp. massiliense]